MMNRIGWTVGIISSVLLAGTASADPPTDARTLTIATVASTVPANGDVNPYGIARVAVSSGNLQEGHILVSNFNNSANLQGTGTTVVDIAPDGTVALFAQIDANSLPGSCPGGVGLTTALAVLRSGWVIVGSLPTTDGTFATAKAGCLIILNNVGAAVGTISGNLVNGPWDMAAQETPAGALLFVTNVLNGTVAASPNVVNEGTVVRIALATSGLPKPEVVSMTVIGSGFAERTDPAAVVIGPTGAGLDASGVLYVADSLNNRIAAIPNAVLRGSSAGTGITLTQGGSLNDPLGLTVGPKQQIVTVNGADGYLLVTSPKGTQYFRQLIDNNGTPPGSGALFGLAFAPEGLYFVDDATNTLNILTQ